MVLSSSLQSACLAAGRMRARALDSLMPLIALACALFTALASTAAVPGTCFAVPSCVSAETASRVGTASPRVVVLTPHAASPRDSVDILRRRGHPGPRPPGAVIDGEWSLLSGPLDPPRTAAGVLVHDARKHVLVLVNGNDFHELWALSVGPGRPAWQRVLVTGSDFPEARVGFAAAYDSLRNRIIVFGGTTNPLGDVWALTLGDTPTWTQIAPLGTPPAARCGAAAIYDPARDRMVLFGGSVLPDYSGAAFADTWALSLAGTPAWSPLATGGTSPSARQAASAVYDPWNDRMLIFGGWDGGTGTILSDTWALALGGAPTWSQIPAANAPRGRQHHAAIVDPATRRMVISGGDGWQQDAYLADTWALPIGDGTAGGAWTQLATTGANPRVGSQAAAYVPEHGSLLEFGGEETGNLCYELALGSLAWTRVNANAPDVFPPRRQAAELVIEPAANELLVFGGDPDDWTGQPDLWAFSLSGLPVWHQLPASGLPGAIIAPNLAYDSARRRLISFTGNYYRIHDGRIDAVSAMPLDRPRTWEELPVSGTLPPGRTEFTVTYDPKRDRVLLFGGASYFSPNVLYGQDHDDLWALSLRDLTWTHIAPVNSPGARCRQWTGYDAMRDRLLVVAGGTVESHGPPAHLDCWALPLGTDTLRWVPLGADLPPAAIPDPYLLPLTSATIDLLRDRLLFWDGEASVWALQLASPSVWTPLALTGDPPTPRITFSLAYDAEADRMLAYGGWDWTRKGDLLGLAFSRPVGVMLLPPTRYADARGAHLEVAILADAGFSPDSVLTETVTLAGVHALVHSAGRDRPRVGELASENVVPQWRDVNRDGWRDLVLSFPADSIAPGPVDTLLVLRGCTPHFEILGRVHLVRAKWLPWGEPSRAAASPGVLRLEVPTPTSAGLTIGYELRGPGLARVEVFDLAGRRVLVRTIDGADGGAHRLALGTGSLPTGLYLVRLQQSGQAVTARAVVLH
jgi:hypothetical protein